MAYACRRGAAGYAGRLAPLPTLPLQKLQCLRLRLKYGFTLRPSWATAGLAAAQGDADAARQRDEIGKTLDAATLKSARAAAENFRPKSMDPTVNQVTAIP